MFRNGVFVIYEVERERNLKHKLLSSINMLKITPDKAVLRE
jgi:hypothetical protein